MAQVVESLYCHLKRRRKEKRNKENENVSLKGYVKILSVFPSKALMGPLIHPFTHLHSDLINRHSLSTCHLRSNAF
jgi:hypothetical protein